MLGRCFFPCDGKDKGFFRGPSDWTFLSRFSLPWGIFFFFSFPRRGGLGPFSFFLLPSFFLATGSWPLLPSPGKQCFSFSSPLPFGRVSFSFPSGGQPRRKDNASPFPSSPPWWQPPLLFFPLPEDRGFFFPCAPPLWTCRDGAGLFFFFAGV